jgi:hypothetical protein
MVALVLAIVGRGSEKIAANRRAKRAWHAERARLLDQIADLRRESAPCGRA